MLKVGGEVQADAVVIRRRERMTAPRPAKPSSIIAHVAGSGTPVNGTEPERPVADTPSTAK